MDRLTAMQVFTEVAASGSFSATADKLDMSRAMVTRYVEELEEWLDARLLQRTTRRVSLTDAGERCLARSQQMLLMMQDLQQETARPDGELHGQLRLTSSVSFAYAQLATAVSAFLELHPRLQIDLSLGDGALNLVESRIDLAIRISSDPDPMLIARPLAQCDSMLVASPAYLQQMGTPLRPEDLLQHRCLSHSNFAKSPWQLSQGEQHLALNISSRFTANDATTLMQAALADAGIVMLPTYLVSQQLKDGRLQPILPQWQLPSFTISALYPSRRHLSPAVRALLDFLVQRFANALW